MIIFRSAILGTVMTQVFPLAQPQSSGSSLMFLLIFPLIFVPLLGIFAYLKMAPRLIRLEVSHNQLRIAGALFYGRTIPISDLYLEQAQRVDLANSKEFRLTLRTNGTGMPGYKAGWFR